MNYTDLLNQVHDQGYPLRKVPYDQWKRDLIEFAVLNPENSWNVYLPLIADVDANFLSMPRFGQGNTRAGLKGSSIGSAPLLKDLLPAYFRYFIEADKLPSPPDIRGDNSG